MIHHIGVFIVSFSAFAFACEWLPYAEEEETEAQMIFGLLFALGVAMI